MRLNSLFFNISLMLLILVNTNSRADNPSDLFGIELGQDVFKLSSIEKFGSAHMNFKIEPKTPMAPFDLYSIKADNDFRVLSIFARAKVASDECEGELKKIVDQIESSLGVRFNETLKKKKTMFVSQDNQTIMAISCNRYRKYREKQLKDIVLVLASTQTTVNSLVVDKIKSSKMSGLLRKNRMKKNEIKLELDHDFSGEWSTDCSNKNSAIGIMKLRDKFYHFLICSTAKCINLPGISSDNVKIVDTKHLKIAEQQYELCTDI